MNVTLGVAALIAMVLALPVRGEAQIAAIDLGTLGGTNSNAVAINDHGQVVGNSELFPGETVSHSFSWTAAGGMVDLGTLGGTNSNAVAVNDNGQVAGNSELLPEETVSHAFSWTAAGGMVDLGTLGGSNSRASAINDNGLVVGESDLPGDTSTHAFLWTAAGGMVDLGTLSGADQSQASAVNNHGQVVGDSGGHAFSWTAAGGMVNLGTLGGFYRAVAVNDKGQVVGNRSSGARDIYGIRPFSWTSAGGMIDLAVPNFYPTLAVAVNDNGQVVGGNRIGYFFNPYHALLWTAAGAVVDLGEGQAIAINNNGQVVGDGLNAFTWTAAGGKVDLGGGPPVAINDKGQVVGYSYLPLGVHAMLWNTRSYDFRFSGVKQPPAFNEVVAGRAVSVSFSLGGNFGLAIFDEGSPTFERIACGASAGVGPIAPTSGAPSGSVIYKPQVDRYAYASKTDRSWAGTCRSLTLRLNDGSSHVVYFSFK